MVVLEYSLNEVSQERRNTVDEENGNAGLQKGEREILAKTRKTTAIANKISERDRTVLCFSRREQTTWTAPHHTKEGGKD